MNAKGWSIDQKYKQALLQVKRPTNIKELRGFPGLTDWQKSSVKSYAEIAASVYALLKKDAMQQGIQALWGPKHDSAFNQLKRNLIEA